jgi:hypothetical protein
MTTKYYMHGNGVNCWTIDLWTGHGHFEKVKDFKAKTSKRKSRLVDTESRQQQQIEYLECRMRATKHLVKLMSETGIPAVGGAYEGIALK